MAPEPPKTQIYTKSIYKIQTSKLIQLKTFKSQHSPDGRRLPAQWQVFQQQEALKTSLLHFSQAAIANSVVPASVLENHLYYLICCVFAHVLCEASGALFTITTRFVVNTETIYHNEKMLG